MMNAAIKRPPNNMPEVLRIPTYPAFIRHYTTHPFDLVAGLATPFVHAIATAPRAWCPRRRERECLAEVRIEGTKVGQEAAEECDGSRCELDALAPGRLSCVSWMHDQRADDLYVKWDRCDGRRVEVVWV